MKCRLSIMCHQSIIDESLMNHYQPLLHYLFTIIHHDPLQSSSLLDGYSAQQTLASKHDDGCQAHRVMHEAADISEGMGRNVLVVVNVG